MKASTAKRKAEAHWNASLIAPGDELAAEYLMGSLDNLKKSMEYYKKAYGESMRESTTIIRKRRSLHWVMGQYLSVRAVLGEAFLRDHWGAAMVPAEVDLKEAKGDGAVWPHGSWLNCI